MSKRPKLHHEDDGDLSSETKLHHQHDVGLSDSSSSSLLSPPPTPSVTPSPPPSSSPPPTSSPPPPSAETTQKVYLSWCKKSGNEYENVPALVERLSSLLWLKGIKVVDHDFVANFPPDEVTSSTVLIFGTINYFADLDCLAELQLIWDAKPFQIIPLFYNKANEMHHFATKYGLGPLYDRPLTLPLNEPWEPRPLKFSVHVGNGKFCDIQVSVPLNEHGRRPKELVDAAIKEQLAKAQANDKEDEAEGGDIETEDDEEGDSDIENEAKGEDVVEAEGEDIETEDKDDGKGGSDTENDEVEDDGKGDSDIEDEDDGKGGSDTKDDSNDNQGVYNEDEEEPLTIGSFCEKMAFNISWMRVPLDGNLQTEYDELNIYALKVWTASNPSGLNYRYKVGLKSHLDALLPYFNHIQEADKGLMCILIGGPAGSGKTTAAKFLYNDISARLKHFDHFNFIRHPTSFSQDKLISYIFGRTPPSFICKNFEEVPFLLFLDNINSVKDTQHIAPVLDLVPKNGSTVVIATRYPDLVRRELPNNTKHHTHPIEKLDEDLSLELFCLRAFEQNHPPKDYIKLAKSAVYRADGSPRKLLYLASQVCLIDENDVRTLVTMEDCESLWDTLESEQDKAITIGECHDKSERKDESKLMFPTSKALEKNIALGLYPLKYLAKVVDEIEKSCLEDDIDYYVTLE